MLRRTGFRPSVVTEDDLPADVLAQIDTKVRAWDYLSSAQKTKAKRIVRGLLYALAAGARSKPGKSLKILTAAVINEAATLSGPYLRTPDRLGRWPNDNDDSFTIICAFRCGALARDMAVDADENATEVSDKQFSDAWHCIRDDQKVLMRRARRIKGKWGWLGLGCG